MRYKKALLVLSMIALALCQKSEAQINPQIGVISEWTVAGTLIGGYAGVGFGPKFKAGVSYETRTRKFDSRFNENLNFKAVYLSYQLLQEKRLGMGILLRGGLENERFVVVVPSLMFNYNFTERISAFTMLGSRSEEPSLGFGMFYTFKRSDQ